MSWTPAAAHSDTLDRSFDRSSERELTHQPLHGGGLRLTRRGRAVVLLTLVTLLLAAFSLGRVGSQAAPRGSQTGAQPQAAPLGQTTVHQGETLWSVAKRVAPGHDPRAVILRLQELNNLDGAGLRAGQLLLLPRSEG